METISSQPPIATPVPALPERADTEPIQEVDIWWGGYATRTLLPSFVGCGLLTLVFFSSAWYLWAEREARPLPARYTAYGLSVLVWLVQLLRWGYFVLTFNYRLTNRRLLRDRHFIHTGCCELKLAAISQVRIEQTPLERRLQVGRLRIAAEDGGLSELVLEGVSHPGRIAARIRKAKAKGRRQRNPGPSPPNKS